MYCPRWCICEASASASACAYCAEPDWLTQTELAERPSIASVGMPDCGPGRERRLFRGLPSCLDGDCGHVRCDQGVDRVGLVLRLCGRERVSECCRCGLAATHFLG